MGKYFYEKFSLAWYINNTLYKNLPSSKYNNNTRFRKISKIDKSAENDRLSVSQLSENEIYISENGWDINNWFYYLTNNETRVINQKYSASALTLRKYMLIETLIAEDGAYPSDGIMEGYYYLKGNKANQPPKISGYDYDMGGKVDDFNIEFTITDNDVNDKVKAEITLRNLGSTGEILRTIPLVSLGTKYTEKIIASKLPIGNYEVEIKATDAEGDYSKRILSFQRENSIPQIEVVGELNLGERNTGFTVKYKVSDKNLDDKLKVVVRINKIAVDQNGNVIQNEELSYTVTTEQLQTFPLNKINEMEIQVLDDKGASNSEYLSFTRVNSLPVISDNDRNLGEKTENFGVKYQVSDIEKDKVYRAILLDGTEIMGYEEVADGVDQVFKFDNATWLSVEPNKTHTLTILATDQHAIDIAEEKGEEFKYVERKFTFKRIENMLEVIFKLKESVDKVEGVQTAELNKLTGRVTAMTLTPELSLASGAEVQYLVANNGNDSAIKWEDATANVKANAKYFFANETKTAEKWRLLVKVIVKRNLATEYSKLRALSGAWGHNSYDI